MEYGTIILERTQGFLILYDPPSLVARTGRLYCYTERIKTSKDKEGRLVGNLNDST